MAAKPLSPEEVADHMIGLHGLDGARKMAELHASSAAGEQRPNAANHWKQVLSVLNRR